MIGNRNNSIVKDVYSLFIVIIAIIAMCWHVHSPHSTSSCALHAINFQEVFDSIVGFFHKSVLFIVCFILFIVPSEFIESFLYDFYFKQVIPNAQLEDRYVLEYIYNLNQVISLYFYVSISNYPFPPIWLKILYYSLPTSRY